MAATIKQLLAAGVTEIDLTDESVQIRGRGGMAPYGVTPLSYATLTKLSRQEEAELAKRPVKFIPPHPAVVAARDWMGRDAFLTETKKFAQRTREARVNNPWSVAKVSVTRADLREEAEKELARQPNSVVLAGLVAWFGGEPSEILNRMGVAA